MPAMRGLLAPQNTFLDTIATRFDGTRESGPSPLAWGVVHCLLQLGAHGFPLFLTLLKLEPSSHSNH